MDNLINRCNILPIQINDNLKYTSDFKIYVFKLDKKINEGKLKAYFKRFG